LNQAGGFHASARDRAVVAAGFYLESVMISRLAIGLVVSVLASLPPTVSMAAGPPPDAEIEKLIVGKWFQKSFEGDLMIKGTTTYLKDGTFLGEGCITKGGQTLIAIVTGRWRVNNATLTETLEISDPPGGGGGTQSTDAIIEINDKLFRYRTEKNIERVKSRQAD
jgi:hypothetical protein